MKVNENITRLWTFLVGSSVLFSSCEGDLLVESGGIDYKRSNFASNPKVALMPFDLQNYLTEDETVMMENICNLTEEVMNNPESSIMFSKNPSALLNEYNLQNTIVEKDSMCLLILQSLCNPDAIRALQEDDFETYLSILNEVGVPVEQIFDNIRNQSDKSNNKGGSLRSVEISESNLVFVVPVLAVAYLYVGVATIAAVEVAAAVHFAVKVSGPSSKIQNIRSIGDAENIYERMANSIGISEKDFIGIIDAVKEKTDHNNNSDHSFIH